MSIMKHPISGSLKRVNKLGRRVRPDAIITHAQITDVYLLGLAVHNKGKFATLDQRISVDAVRGGRQALEIITA